MGLADVLGFARDFAEIAVLSAGVSYVIDKSILNNYVPWAEKLQKKCDEDEKEKNDDYRFSNGE